MRRLPPLLAAVALAATACQSAQGAPERGDGAAGVGSAVSAASVQVLPGPDAQRVQPTDRIEIRPVDGTLSDVQVVTDAERRVRGRIGDDGVWRSKAQRLLAYGTTYTVTAQAVDAAGRTAVVKTHFRTVQPRKRLTTSISPVAGQVVGVGMPVIVRLSAPVEDRAAVQRALTVRTSRDVEGSWGWLSDSELHWRPREYWPANTDVAVKVDLRGVRAGGGVWGAEDRTVRYRVGSATVSVVDVDDHTMTVRQGGEVTRTVPITTGKDGFITRNGIKVITSKERMRVMDAATIDIAEDDPEYYRLEVEYALRLTWSGEFVHAAPWSVGSQGEDNVSHGCTGMSLSNAAWFYGISKVGDPVEYVGSDRPLEPGNGWTDWNVPWRTWVSRSAI